jgi:hypothetical protein
VDKVKLKISRKQKQFIFALLCFTLQTAPKLQQSQTVKSSSSSAKPVLSFEEIGKVEEAKKCSNLAASALAFSDVRTALMHLKKAVALLETVHQ